MVAGFLDSVIRCAGLVYLRPVILHITSEKPLSVKVSHMRKLVGIHR